jgi:hypothetical protein
MVVPFGLLHARGAYLGLAFIGIYYLSMLIV